jgi:hypothetical protein
MNQAMLAADDLRRHEIDLHVKNTGETGSLR